MHGPPIGNAEKYIVAWKVKLGSVTERYLPCVLSENKPSQAVLEQCEGQFGHISMFGVVWHNNVNLYQNGAVGARVPPRLKGKLQIAIVVEVTLPSIIHIFSRSKWLGSLLSNSPPFTKKHAVGSPRC